jgi:hypothetical protein
MTIGIDYQRLRHRLSLDGGRADPPMAGTAARPTVNDSAA